KKHFGVQAKKVLSITTTTTDLKSLKSLKGLNNVTPINLRAPDNSPFSSEQLTWISEIDLPKRVFLKGADRTDDNTLTL
ncbi:hypothetical protein EAY03_23265, partial [Vibrio anguillarum]|nr:hypothetical protein [Vibrio anguillarum]